MGFGIICDAVPSPPASLSSPAPLPLLPPSYRKLYEGV